MPRLFITAKLTASVSEKRWSAYFTIQSAMLAVVTLLVAAAYALLRPVDPPLLGAFRTMVTVYLLVSGIVFAVIVLQASTRDYRVDVPWSDTLLHFVVPVLALIASFYFDLPAGPACAALLALSVAVAAIATVYTGGRKPLLRFVRQPQAGTARV